MSCDVYLRTGEIKDGMHVDIDISIKWWGCVCIYINVRDTKGVCFIMNDYPFA